MSISPRIIGLAGAFASGKDSLAFFLEDRYKIKHISTSDIVREFAKEKYGSIERPVLYKTANELRHSKGAGVLAQLAIERYDSYREEYPGGVCVSGFRAWAEAAVVKEAGGVIVFVDAPARVRYQRTLDRARDKEIQNSYEDFLQREARENGGEHSEFNIAYIKTKADIVLDNGGEISDFLQEAVTRLGFAQS